MQYLWNVSGKDLHIICKQREFLDSYPTGQGYTVITMKFLLRKLIKPCPQIGELKTFQLTARYA